MDYQGRMRKFTDNRFKVVDGEMESISFRLDGKHFIASSMIGKENESSGMILKTLRGLVGRKFTLRTDSDDWVLNDGDHCFIEKMKRTGPATFEIVLGS
jgi:hypothetical protein